MSSSYPSPPPPPPALRRRLHRLRCLRCLCQLDLLLLRLDFEHLQGCQDLVLHAIQQI